MYRAPPRQGRRGMPPDLIRRAGHPGCVKAGLVPAIHDYVDITKKGRGQATDVAGLVPAMRGP
jgi:hypothetical protein